MVETTGIEKIFSADPDCFVIAEIAQAHDGSLGMAHAYIDAVARTGADAIKFQTHIAAAESSLQETWRVKFSYQDATRFEYWRRMEFTPEQWAGLKSHAEEKGLVFLSSPFSIDAVRLLHSLGMVAWKIASGEVTNVILLDHVVRTGRPVLLSSGMSSWAELDAAVDFVRSSGLSLAVMQCTTAYPCRPEEIGLNVLGEMRQRYGCPVGLSDHSATIYPSLAAVTLGAKVVEVHVTMSREMFGPDVAASVTTEGLRQLVEGVRAIATMRSHPIDKEAAAAGFAEMRQRFGQSIVAARDLPEGTVLAMEHLSCRKPATGISAASLHRVLGRRLSRGVSAGEFLSPGDFEG